MDRKIPLGLKYAVAILTIFCFIYALSNSNSTKQKQRNLEEKIMQGFNVVCGKLVSITYETNNRDTLTCDYFYDSHFTSLRPCKMATKNRFDSGNTHIFIAVAKNDPEANILLEDGGDFSRFNVSINDTVGIKCNN